MKFFWIVAVALWAGVAVAEDRTLVLVADARLEASGLLRHLVPRFALKTGIRVEVLAIDDAALGAALDAGRADVLLAGQALVLPLAEAAGRRPPRVAFRALHAGGGGAYAAMLLDSGPGAEHGRRFVDWLYSDIGQNTLAQFAGAGGQVYAPGDEPAPEPEPVVPEGDVEAGAHLALFHCGRCHVVSEANRFSGIGSTPSFAALRALPQWQEKFSTFWMLNPHPVFTQVEGLTEPFDPARPPHVAPVELSFEDLTAIVAFVATIRPRDLGAPVEAR